jgi:hypothetical protein
MLPGPTAIIACPTCGGLLKRETWLSGNTFGAKLYTDGRQVAPMMPWQPPMSRCPHCSAFFWLANMPEVRTLDDGEEFDVRSEPRNPLALPEPSEADYYEALKSGLAKDRDQERQIRTVAWWRSNDAFRELGSPLLSAHSDLTERRENLNSLLTLLSKEDSPEAVIMRAELLRELGDFDRACAALNSLSDPNLKWVAVQLRDLCEKRDTQVRELVPPGTKRTKGEENQPADNTRPGNQARQNADAKEGKSLLQRLRLYTQLRRAGAFLALARREELRHERLEVRREQKENHAARRRETLRVRAEKSAAWRAKREIVLRKTKKKAGLIVGLIAAGTLGYFYWDDQDWIERRAEEYYGEREFQVVGYQGYSFRLTGRCYRYTLQKYGGAGRGLYESCLTKWWGEIQEHDLHRL